MRIAYNGLNPWRNQYIAGPWTWTVNSSLFKVVQMNDRLRLRVSLDAFNVFNNPGMPQPDPNTGLLSLQTSANPARQLQWTMRLTW